MEYQEKKRRAIEMRLSGCKYEEIKTELGYKSDSQLAKIFKDEGIQVCWHEDRDKTIVKMRNDGYSMREIAEALGLTHGIVSNVCRKYGVGGKKATGRIASVPDLGEAVCLYCGRTFMKHRQNHKYCCEEHRKKSVWMRHDIQRRKRVAFATVDSDISLQKLFLRDNGICHICGGKCDWNDYKIINGKKYASKTYPTIDHLIPITKGGLHEWANISLAHFSCNASKGNRCGY